MAIIYRRPNISFGVIICLLFFANNLKGQERKKVLPIIDMHLHAFDIDVFGKPPLKIGAPFDYWAGNDPQHNFADVFFKEQKSAEWSTHFITSPKTDDELEQATIRVLRKRNIYGVLSGSVAKVRKWKTAEPKHIIQGVYWDFSQVKSAKLDVDSLHRMFQSGEFKVFSEVAIQYDGILPSDTVFEPYLKMAEELDIPLGIHIGPGPPGAPYQGASNYRAKMHSPLVLEEALIRHPKLRVYAMHAGWPMIDDMIAMLYTYPQLYVDLGVIDYIIPKKEFYQYLKRLVDAGFEKRIMYGSDQMIWPGAMEKSIQNIENAPFLSEKQKRDIFFNNAARFLRLTKDQIRGMTN